MARGDVLLESLISYYSTLGMDAVALLRSTREDIRTEQFGCERTAGRAAAWWSDALEGWWSAMLASATPPLPTLFLTCRADSGSHTNYIKIIVPGVAAPLITTLARVGTGEALAAEVDVELTHFRDQITVKLSNLNEPTPGTYQAIVHLDERPLLLVLAEIQPAGRNNANKLFKVKAGAKGKAGAKRKAGAKGKASRKKV